MLASMEQTRDNVHEVVRAFKRVSGTSDGQVAAALGLSRTVINQRMTGTTKWNIEELAALAEFFGVPIGLFYEEPREAVRQALQADIAFRFYDGKVPTTQYEDWLPDLHVSGTDRRSQSERDRELAWLEEVARRPSKS